MITKYEYMAGGKIETKECNYSTTEELFADTELYDLALIRYYADGNWITV